MSSKTRRTVIVLATLATLITLSLPLAAQGRPDRQEDPQGRQETRTAGLFAQLWERLTAPFAVFLDGTAGSTVPPPPPPPVDPGDTTDGRSIIDPIG